MRLELANALRSHPKGLLSLQIGAVGPRKFQRTKMKRLALAVIAATLLNSAAAQKKPKPTPDPPPTYNTEQIFHSPCDTVWPLAVQTAMAAGWSVKTSDRSGGILMLEWIKGEWYGTRFANPQITQNTIEKASSFQHQWHTFRIVSASIISATEGTGCKYAVSVVMQGDELTKGWRVLQSNGFIEAGLLERIESRLAKVIKYR
jgi:hypothetical protein